MIKSSFPRCFPLFAATCVCLGLACGGSDIIRLYWDQQGYSAFRTPKDYILPGAVISYDNGQEMLEATDRKCFPDAPRIQGTELLWSRDAVYESDFRAALLHFPQLQNADTLDASFQRLGVRKLTVKMSPAHAIEIPGGYVDSLVAALNATKDRHDICSLVFSAGDRWVVTRVVMPDTARFVFEASGNRSIQGSLTKILGLSAGADSKWREDGTLEVRRKTAVAYKRRAVRKVWHQLGGTGDFHYEAGPEDSTFTEVFGSRKQ